MGHIDKKVTTCVRVSFSRLEVLEKLGFDMADAFYVSLDDYGNTGITFDVSPDKAGKYEENPEPVAGPGLGQDQRRVASPWLGQDQRRVASPWLGQDQRRVASPWLRREKR